MSSGMVQVVVLLQGMSRGEEEEAALFSDRGETRDMKCEERKK